MKILMIGWELPPHNSGGLGVASLGLAKALSQKGMKVTFVLPKKVDVDYKFMDVIFADVAEVEKLGSAYTHAYKYFDEEVFPEPPTDFVNAALSYGEKIEKIAKKVGGDVIHSHDWLTSPAGVAAKKTIGRPLVAHVHSTEFDRTGGHAPHPQVFRIEKAGMEKADRVISVSEYTKNLIVQKYAIANSKIDVIHNGVDEFAKQSLPPALVEMKKMGYKVVLFLGRLTLHKGPDYFVYAAKKILDYLPKTVFVVAGDGDMQGYIMAKVAELGLINNFIFTGFLRGQEKDRVWQSADLYVMPSVSEPFGITALESIANKTPVLMSKQAGASEILSNVLKVDFWDIDEIVNKSVAVLTYPGLGKDLRRESIKELPNINWQAAADRCISVYNQLV